MGFDEVCFHWMDKVVLLAWDSLEATKQLIESWASTLVVVTKIWRDLCWTLSPEYSVPANELCLSKVN